MSPINVNALYEGLATHPDKQFVDTIIDHALYGAPMGYSGPRNHRIHKNWPSAYKHREAVESIISRDISRGRKLGPYSHPPLINFVGSPMGAFERSTTGKHRVIYDLSWPPTHSVNDHINIDCSLHYVTVDTAVSMVKKYGQGALMARLDIEDAFKNIIVHPDDWDLLGTTWDRVGSDGTITKEYYIDTVLPFGARSSPKLFDNFARALEFIMKVNGVKDVIHYLDDYFTVGPPDMSICASNLHTMRSVCEQVGFKVQNKKVLGPANKLEFLGIEIDSVRMETRITQQRLHDILRELGKFLLRTRCTKRELLSLIGKLIFVTRIVRAGRTFTRRMIELSKKVKYLHYKVKLNKECRRDILWWHHYLPTWNGRYMLFDEHWSTNAELHLHTDACGESYGAYFGTSWIMDTFTDDDKHRTITWKELYAIVMSCATWGNVLRKKRILFHCDNLAVVHIIQNGVCKNSDIMTLVRTLFYICAKYNIECSAVHVVGVLNQAADALSRGQLSKFYSLIPDADRHATLPIYKNITDYCELT